MNTTARERLLDLLRSIYPDLKRQMTRRLGSSDLAEEALHDAYLRLHRSEGLGEVKNPKSYLYSIVLNTAKNQVRADSRRSAAFRPTDALEVADVAPGPLQIAEARSDIAAVERALATLPPRRLAIFRRSWIDDAPYAVIAAEFGIAERTVRHELQTIARHLHNAVKEKSLAELQTRLAEVSLERGRGDQ